jgi:hypothetical protein
MNDDFEQKLRRQSLRQVPAEWREEILAAASGRESRVKSREQERRWPSTLASRLSTLLWPHPQAWAGLAAVWILIFMLDFSIRDKSPVVAEKSAPPSSEVIVELRQQRQLLAELIGPRETRVTGPLKIFGRQPRSERRFEIMTT